MYQLSAPTYSAPGANTTFTLTLSNSGPDAASMVTLTDNLPTGTTYVSQTQTGGPSFTLSHPGTQTSDTISSFASGSTATFAIVVSLPSTWLDGLTVTDSASVTAAPMLSGSSVLSASVNTTVQHQTDLQVSQSASSTVVAGNNLTWTVTLTNNGPNAASSVTLADTLPTGTTYVTQSQTSGSSSP